MTDLAGRYRLADLLGRGGVADVYRARDLVLDRDVAVKILHDTVDDAERRRFVGEARMLARLSHAGVVTVLDVGVSGTQTFLVMDLVEGTNLADVLREGPLPLERVGDIGSQLASAIAYAHAQGVIHRDVKPSNVLLGASGDAQLADFGIARIVGDTMRHTRTGTTVGTPAYLSPEQARGAMVGPPTDVYSLGLVLLEALTGDRVFMGTPVESAVARLHRAPAVPDDLPDDWRALLVAMTATDPVDRPSAADVAARLGETAGPTATRVLDVAAGGPVPRSDDAPTEPMVAAGRSTSHRPLKVVAVLAATVVVIVVLAVAGAVLPGGDGDDDSDPPVDSSAATATPRPDRSSNTSDPTTAETSDPGDAGDQVESEGAGKGPKKDKDKGGKGKGGKSNGGKGKGKGKG